MSVVLTARKDWDQPVVYKKSHTFQVEPKSVKDTHWASSRANCLQKWWLSLRGKFPKLNAGFWPHRQSQVAAAARPLGVGTALGVLMGCSHPKVLRRRERGWGQMPAPRVGERGGWGYRTWWSSGHLRHAGGPRSESHHVCLALSVTPRPAVAFPTHLSSPLL